MNNEKSESGFSHKDVENIIESVESEKRETENKISDCLQALKSLRCKYCSLGYLEEGMRKKYSEMTGKSFQKLRF